MKVFAIQINETTLPLIALLNNGVAPEVDGGWTWFLFEMFDNGAVGVREVVKYTDCLDRYGSFKNYRDFCIYNITMHAREGL